MFRFQLYFESSLYFEQQTLFVDWIWGERRREKSGRLRFLAQVTKRMELPSSEMEVGKSRALLVIGWLWFWTQKFEMSTIHSNIMNGC